LPVTKAAKRLVVYLVLVTAAIVIFFQTAGTLSFWLQIAAVVVGEMLLLCAFTGFAVVRWRRMTPEQRERILRDRFRQRRRTPGADRGPPSGH
jgi:heme O synthase-like polyprenyltransferase